MRAPLHRDAARILERLSREQVTALYHFTSIENLPVIRQMNALCSKETLESAGLWPPPEPGGNDLSQRLDRMNGNWNRLSLNLTPHTPMAYRKKPGSHLCFFALKIDIAALAEVVFTNTNATAGSQLRTEGLAGLNLVNFPAIRSFPRPGDREGWVRPVQAEVLIPDQVSLDYVLEVAFVSEASLEEGIRLWGPLPHPPFKVAPHYFADVPHVYASRIVLNFAHLLTLLLTDEPIDSSTVRTVRTHRSQFRRQPDGDIIAVAKVRVTTGARSNITWNPGAHSVEGEFERSGEYFQWAKIQESRLPDGHCSVEYRLNGIRWATVAFYLSS